VSPCELADERGGGAKSYDGEKAWSSKNHSILSGTATHLRLNNNLKELISLERRCRGTIQQGSNLLKGLTTMSEDDEEYDDNDDDGSGHAEAV
jgi:hypothetical protein